MRPLLMTRPAPQGAQFADKVAEALPGRFAPVFSPLFEIVTEQVSIDLDGVQALLFTSRNGVAAFLELAHRRDIPALCVGDATTALAEDAGLMAVSAHGDAAALATLAAQSYLDGAGHFLHLRGAEAAGDVVGALAAEGIPATDQIVYDQRPLPLTDAARALLDGSEAVIVPLFSPRTAQLFDGDLEDAPARAPLTIVALSRAVAARIRPETSQNIEIAESPDAASMIKVLAKL